MEDDVVCSVCGEFLVGGACCGCETAEADIVGQIREAFGQVGDKADKTPALKAMFYAKEVHIHMKG
jgi:hypothetical protein